MHHPRRHAGLANEPRARLRIRAAMAQHLQRYAPAEVFVFGLEHHAHAAFAELAQHAVVIHAIADAHRAQVSRLVAVRGLREQRLHLGAQRVIVAAGGMQVGVAGLGTLPERLVEQPARPAATAWRP